MRGTKALGPLILVLVVASLAAAPLAAAATADSGPPAVEPAPDTAATGCATESPVDVDALLREPTGAMSRPAPSLDAAPTPVLLQGPPHLRRYCKCGCGITCETDADCGAGGSCVAFVTCC